MTDAQEHWARCKNWIASALTRTGFYDIEDIERAIDVGDMVFWPGEHGAAVTEFITYPNGKALNVFAGGGDSNASLQEFIDVFEPSLSAWAEASDCRWIIGYGRPGWERVLKQRGYSTIWSVMKKDIINGR